MEAYLWRQSCKEFTFISASLLLPILTVLGLDLNLKMLFFFFAFRAALAAYGGSKARGPIGAVASSHSHAGSEPSRQPTAQLKAMPDP